MHGSFEVTFGRGWELEFGIGNSSALSCSFRCSRQVERCFIIQSSSACSKPISCPAFSLSTHLCRKICSRSAKNSLYNVEFLTNSAASFSDGSICCSVISGCKALSRTVSCKVRRVAPNVDQAIELKNTISCGTAISPSSSQIFRSYSYPSQHPTEMTAAIARPVKLRSERTTAQSRRLAGPSQPQKRLRRNRDAGPQIFGLKSYRIPLFLFLRRGPMDVFTKLGKVFSISGILNLRTYQTALSRDCGTAFIRRRFAAHVSPEADGEVSRIR